MNDYYWTDEEERRYRAFKERFLEEQNEARIRQLEADGRSHEEALLETFGTHGQG